MAWFKKKEDPFSGNNLHAKMFSALRTEEVGLDGVPLMAAGQWRMNPWDRLRFMGFPEWMFERERDCRCHECEAQPVRKKLASRLFGLKVIWDFEVPQGEVVVERLN